MISKVLLGLAVATAVATSSVASVGATSPNSHVPGNNGTLKVHEQGTPANTESNDPKVCVFNFEGYGFDKGQSGTIVISAQLNGKDTTGVKQVNMPAANANGYTETAYVTVPNGHYKTTVYGKDAQGNPDYNNDLKAKSKVIKVTCNTSTTPTKPTNPGNGSGHVNAGGVNKTTTQTGAVAGAQTTATPTMIPETGSSLLVNALGALTAGAGTYLSLLRRK